MCQKEKEHLSRDGGSIGTTERLLYTNLMTSGFRKMADSVKHNNYGRFRLPTLSFFSVRTGAYEKFDEIPYIVDFVTFCFLL